MLQPPDIASIVTEAPEEFQNRVITIKYKYKYSNYPFLLVCLLENIHIFSFSSLIGISIMNFKEDFIRFRIKYLIFQKSIKKYL